MKREKAFTIVCGVVCFLGFMFLLGTVGAMENDNISLGRGMNQLVVGLVMFAGAGHLGGFMR